MQRIIQQKLTAWKTQPNRKPLILKGARQVGKTYSLQHFGETAFTHCHYINFERENLDFLFEKNFDVKRILNELSFHLGTAIDVQNDLVIFDEIQACPRALTSLKYFCEDCPELALCAAGSLLGVLLNDTAFPVGKVDWLNLFPMTFSEFLLAAEQTQLADYLAHPSDSEIAHQKLWEQLKYYFIVGGLPEAVQSFVDHRDDLYTAFDQARATQNHLIKDYYADMAKHAGKINAMHIDRVWRAIPTQLAQAHDATTQRFRFKGVVPGIDRYARLANVIDWLDNAGLILKAPITHQASMPLSAYTRDNVFKLFLFDVGILGAISGLHPKTLLEYDYGTYKGYFAENFVAQCLHQQGVPLFSWQEGRAEIEFLDTRAGEMIPIEVKSGSVTHAKSLSQYRKKYQPAQSIIYSAKAEYHDVKTQTHYLPLYMAGSIAAA